MLEGGPAIMSSLVETCLSVQDVWEGLLSVMRVRDQRDWEESHLLEEEVWRRSSRREC